MIIASLAVSITCFLVILACIARFSYLYGQMQSDDEWKAKYEKLYTTATAEILKAKGYSGTTIGYQPKATDTKNNLKKIKPLEKLTKEKSDPILNSTGLRIVRTDDESDNNN